MPRSRSCFRTSFAVRQSEQQERCDGGLVHRDADLVQPRDHVVPRSRTDARRRAPGRRRRRPVRCTPRSPPPAGFPVASAPGPPAAAQHLRGAEHVAAAQPRQRPRLGEAAQHQHVGQRTTGERLGSPGTASANASSTTTIRPGRRSARISSAGCSTEVGLVGLPITTRSAESGTAAASQRRTAASSSTCVTGTSASRSAHSGSVNDGWISAATAEPEPRQQREALGPAREQQHLVGRAAVPRGDGGPGRAIGRRRWDTSPGAATRRARRSRSHSGGPSPCTLTAKSRRPGPASTSPW